MLASSTCAAMKKGERISGADIPYVEPSIIILSMK